MKQLEWKQDELVEALSEYIEDNVESQVHSYMQSGGPGLCLYLHGYDRKGLVTRRRECHFREEAEGRIEEVIGCLEPCYRHVEHISPGPRARVKDRSERAKAGRG